jgi:hypothetical protein
MSQFRLDRRQVMAGAGAAAVSVGLPAIAAEPKAALYALFDQFFEADLRDSP